MSDKIQKVLDAFQNYKETTNNIIRDYPDLPNNSQLTYKELKDDEILSLDMLTIKEYLERMEQIRNNQEELLELMYEDLGSLLYVYAIQNEDYELLSKNFAQIRAYMIQQGLTLEQYREYYEGEKEATTE